MYIDVKEKKMPSIENLNKWLIADVASNEIEAKDNQILPLHCAVLNNRLRVVKHLLENGCDINQANFEEKTAIFFANEVEMLKYLIELGADINVLEKNGDNFLQYIAYCGNFEVMEFAIKELGFAVKYKKEGKPLKRIQFNDYIIPSYIDANYFEKLKYCIEDLGIMVCVHLLGQDESQGIKRIFHIVTNEGFDMFKNHITQETMS